MVAAAIFHAVANCLGDFLSKVGQDYVVCKDFCCHCVCPPFALIAYHKGHSGKPVHAPFRIAWFVVRHLPTSRRDFVASGLLLEAQSREDFCTRDSLGGVQRRRENLSLA